MKLIRTFHPVGHGAFYTERFYDDATNVANVVYDCGTQTKGCNLPLIINNEFAPTDTIDAIFISHFHDDHVKGIVDLCRRCRVHKIIVPLLPDDYKVWTILYNAIKYGANSIANQIILSNVIGNNFFPDTEIVPIDDEYSLPIIFSHHNQPLWEYRAYRLPNYSPTFSTRYHLLISALQGDPLFKTTFVNGNIDYSILYNMLSSNPNILILKSIISSTHIKLDDNSFNMIVSSQRTYYHGVYLPSYLGCLYTGDAELKSVKRFKTLQSKFNLDRWSYHVIQVPHHGAYLKNHNKSLYDQGQISIVSARKNDNKHPNINVIKDILGKQCFPKIVTEDLRTYFQLTYPNVL